MIQEPPNEQILDLRFQKIPFEERVPDYKIDLSLIQKLKFEQLEGEYRIHKAVIQEGSGLKGSMADWI